MAIIKFQVQFGYMIIFWLVERDHKCKNRNSDIRPNNSALDEEVFEDDNEQYQMFAGLLNFNPNLILYGPPGTVKTYATKRL